MKSKLFNTIRLIWKVRFLEKILVKLTSDKIYGSPITKLPPNNYQYKSGTIRKTRKNGINYELDISDMMDWYIYFGFKEVAKLKLYNLVNKDDTVFDIGANIGETTLHFAKISGDKGSVHSFEPDPINYKRIKKNLSINNFKNINLINVGLGDVKGTFKIHTVDEKNKGMNRIVPDNNDIDNYREIQVTTIDEYVKNHTIQKINLIKIDVEGFELNVLRGGTKTLNNYFPKLFIELDDRNLNSQGSSAAELISFLTNIGYEIHHAETNQKIESDTNFSDCHYDIIAKKS